MKIDYRAKFEALKEGKEKLCVVGLGYVGLPLAVAFAKKRIKVIGFDVNKEKIELYKQGIDPTSEVGSEGLKEVEIEYTDSPLKIGEASFIIVAVPTPITGSHKPDLELIRKATELVGLYSKRGSVIVYESTVYPGVTEEFCVPIIECFRKYKCGEDFKIGYSPERINPGDKVHRLSNIKKIVSGSDEEALSIITDLYNLVVEVGVHPVSDMKTAEAIKVIENSQRDINIAFMNEVSIILHRLNIDSREVIEGMNTKWNALGFQPGLVGGHCIGVDPYYFVYKAEKVGYHSQIILNGRIINDSMGKFIAESIVREMIVSGINPITSKVSIMGITFKENCPDIRNSKVVELLKSLERYNIKPLITDYWADSNEVKKEYGIDLVSEEKIKDSDCIIVAVAHDKYKELGVEGLKKFFIDEKKCLLVDVKSILDLEELKKSGLSWWRL